MKVLPGTQEGMLQRYKGGGARDYIVVTYDAHEPPQRSWQRVARRQARMLNRGVVSTWRR